MKAFFKQTLATLLGNLLSLVLTLAVSTTGLLLIVFFLTYDSGPVVKEKSILIVDLATPIQDTEPVFSLGSILSNDQPTPLSLRRVVEALDKASQDDRIVGIFLDGRQGGGAKGYANLQEIRTALERFQKAGKKVIAYGVDWREPDYFLASIADEVVMNPLGSLELNGFGTEPLFYQGAFEKYGIGVQAVRVGQFKGAIEPFTRQDLSPQNRQQIEALLGGVWQTYLQTVAANRAVNSEQLQAIADSQGLLLAENAQQEKLIDKVAYWDQMIEQLKGMSIADQGTQKTFRQITLANYLDVPVKAVPERQSENKIAILYAEGTIVNGDGTEQTVGGDRFVRFLRQIRDDEQVKALVLRINSPGGSATASEMILRELQLFAQKKPVIISMGNVAASGGYWIALGGQRIFAEPTTVTGSIGVFSLLFNVGALGNRFGLTWDQVQTAKLANLGSGVRPKTEAELAIFQGAVNQVYDLFLNKVAKARNLPKTQVSDIAQGRVWTGLDAQKIGLVDELGSLQTAIAYAAKQAKLGEDWQLEEYPKSKDLETVIVEKLFKAQAQFLPVKPAVNADPLSQQWQQFRQEFTELQTLNDPKGIYARLPFNWQWH